MSSAGRAHGLAARARVLLALRGSEQPVAALASAQELASRLGGDLTVLRVISAPSRLRRLLERRSKIERMRDAHRTSRQWLVQQLGEHGRFVPITIALGGFVERTSSQARAMDCHLVVVAPRAFLGGGGVTALARRSNRAVLAARGSSGGQVIVAATDLRVPGLPVVGHAARLAQQLGADLVAVHNVDPIWIRDVGPALPKLGIGDVVPRQHETHSQQERLGALTSHLPISVAPLVTSRIDPVYAILEAAQARGAGLIVVGTRQRPALERLLSGSIAAQVVSRARRSVLVAPIEAA